MNQAASFLVNRRALQGVIQNERFLQAEGRWGKGVINKRKKMFQVWSSSFGGWREELHGSYYADYLINADQEISDCLFEGHLLMRG